MENALGSRTQRATHYRQQAGQLREMAKTAPAGTFADQLLDLAAQYERLVERLEPVANPSRTPTETELYRSSNGDQWYLVQEPASEQKFVRHQPNAASGGRSTLISADDFLAEGHGPQHQALLRLIGSERPTDKRD